MTDPSLTRCAVASASPPSPGEGRSQSTGSQQQTDACEWRDEGEESFLVYRCAAISPSESPSSRLRAGETPTLRRRSLLDVEVEGELVGVRAEADRVDLLLALVPDPGADHVAREHVALQQECVVLLQGVQRLVERTRRLGHFR